VASLKKRLLTSFLPVAVIGIFITAAMSAVLFYWLQHGSLQSRLHIGMQNVDLEIDEVTKTLIDTTQSILGQENAGGAILRNDIHSLRRLSWQLGKALHADNVVIFDRAAAAVAQTHQPIQSSQLKTQKGVVLMALAGAIHKHLEQSSAGLSIKIYVPITYKEDVAGVAEVAYVLDHKFISQIKSKYDLEVLIYDGNRLQATTFANASIVSDPELAALNALAMSLRTVVNDELELNGLTYDVSSKPVFANDKNFAGALVLAASHGQFYRALWLMFSGLAVIVVIVVSVVTVTGMRISTGVTRPLDSLVSAAHEVSLGNLGNTVEISGVDETRQLGIAFNTMTDKLRATTTSIEHLNKEVADRKSAEAKLKFANRELEEFVYMVSHDLRGPLTGILGYTEALQTICRDRLDETALDCLREITAAGEKMTMLMEDLLTLATVGRLQKADKPFDARDTVNEVLLSLAVEISSAGVDVKVGALPRVQVPATLLSQIFSNLIGNAIRYGCQVGAMIEVEGERIGEVLRFSVRDHGPGVPPEERERIFEVFFRGRVGKAQKGTGIGLATVRKIARIYGGRAWVEETPGGGSTFIIEMVDPLTAVE